MHSRITHWIVAFFCVSISVCTALLLGQSQNWDQLNYHFYGGYALLDKPFHYDFAPAQVQSFFNPTLHAPIYLMLKYLPSRLTAAILASIQGLNVFLIYRIAKEIFFRLSPLHREVLSLACAATAFYSASNFCELGTTFGDNLISVLSLTAFYLITRYLLQGQGSNRYSLILAGWISGLALGLKLTVSMYTVPLLASLLVVILLSRTSWKPIFTTGISCMVGFLFSYALWGGSLYLEYRNPFFPYFNNFFLSPYYDPYNTMDPRFLPRSWAQTFFYPFFFCLPQNLVSEAKFRDIRLAGCYLMVLVLGIFLLPKLLRRLKGFCQDPGQAREDDFLFFLMFFFISSYILWQRSFSIYRYAVLLEFLAPVFIAAGILRIIRHRMTAKITALAMNGLICIALIPIDFGRQNFEEGYLEVKPPAWQNLESSVILMGGEEATAYIIPSFPVTTRFVRVKSNFIHPGRNERLDQKIRSILAQYRSERTLAYFRSKEEWEADTKDFRYFGVSIQDSSCVEIAARSGNAGYLCRTGATTTEAH